MPQLWKLIGFALVSGVGLGIDFCVFVGMLHMESSIFVANIFAGGCAVTFVYFVSIRRIFAYRGGFLYGLFLAYLGYQIVGVSLASLAVSLLAAQGFPAIAAKIMILPLTFAANYLFMSLLARRRQHD